MAKIPPSTTANSFVESVLRLEPRVTAFDCDGTLWSGDAGERFFDWEMKEGVVSPDVSAKMRARYVEYQAGKVSEDDMCGQMVIMHQGLPEATVMEAATEFMTSAFPGHIFPEMQQLVRQLRRRGCDVWAVSSSNEWLIRAGMVQFDVLEDHVLAAKAVVSNGIVTDQLVRVPSGPGKPKALREVVQKDIDAAFGNSRWDVDMLKFASNAFAINPNPDLVVVAREHGWAVYFPDGIAGH